MNSYIICETAFNHEGDAGYLKRMIKQIGELKVQAIKFHLLLDPYQYLHKEHPLMKSIKNWMFSVNQWKDFIRLSKDNNLDVIALCNDMASLQFVQENNEDVQRIEIHASGLNDYYLLKEAARCKQQVILGIGGSTLDEIEYAIRLLHESGKDDLLLMYGFQSYPTSYKDIHLYRLLKLKQLFDLPVGYADHTSYNDKNNIHVSAAAATLGIAVLEKHYTLNVGTKRVDYQAAVGKEQMIAIQQKMELNLQLYGAESLNMSVNEMLYGNTGPMKKAIVAKNNIYKGEKLNHDNLCFRRTEEESTVRQIDFFRLIGLHAAQNIRKGELIDFTKVKYQYHKTSFYELTGGLEDRK